MIVQSLWIGNDLPTLNYNCIKSWLKFHEVHLYTYNKLENAPDGVKIKDANEILPESDIFYFNENDIAPFSDLFRYKLLCNGGWWIDADFLMTKPLNFSQDYVFGSERTMLVGRFKSKQPYKIVNGFLKAPSDSEFYKKVYEKSLEKIEKKLKRRTDLMMLLSKEVVNNKMEHYVLAPDAFCNLDWWYVKEAFNEPNIDLWIPKFGWNRQHDYLTNENSVGIHLWNGLHKKKKIDTKKYKEGSLYDLLVKSLYNESVDVLPPLDKNMVIEF